MSESSASQLWRGVAFDHAQNRHDQERYERPITTVAEETEELRRKVAFYEDELRREDWQLGPNPEWVRENYRGLIQHFREELGRTVPVLLLAAE